MGQFVDITGKKFNRLLVLRASGRDKYGQAIWDCRCDCGNEITATGYQIRNGRIMSCGCYLHEITVERDTKHGKSGIRIYRIWSGMKTRCTNKNRKEYKHYGGRGITVCAEWKDNFLSFYEWAMSHGYRDDLTIDRKDNDGNYEPGNCRWIKKPLQVLNYSQNKNYIIEGEKKCLSEWCRVFGVPRKMVSFRIAKGLDILSSIEKTKAYFSRDAPTVEVK
jgi:hypothetical protein